MEEEDKNNIDDRIKNENQQIEHQNIEKQEQNNDDDNNKENKEKEINEIIENKISEEPLKINLEEEISQINNINLNQKEENNDNNINININLNIDNQRNESEMTDDMSLINIDLEKEKNEKNKINQIEDIEENNEEEKVDDYLFNDNNKYNKEYTEDDNDLHSRRLTARNNEEYLLKADDKNDLLGNYKNDETEEQSEDDNLFPFKTVGDTLKKSSILGQYNYRYLELDAVKGVLKRYLSTKEYPKRPTEIINIKNFKLIKKVKLIKEFYDLEITYIIEKKGKKYENIENYRFRNQECRNKWFDSLLMIWKFLIKGTPEIKLNKNILAFVDDRLGIIQEIGRGKKNINKKKKIDLKKFKISTRGGGVWYRVQSTSHINR